MSMPQGASPHDPLQAPAAHSSPVPPGPFAPPAPAPKKKSFFARHKVLTVLGGGIALVTVIAIASGGGGSDDSDSASGGESAQTAQQDGAGAPQEEAAPGIGTPVRDGKFEFTVTGIEPAGTRIGTDVLGQDAQGQFLLVRVTVANIGDEAQFFDGTSQTLFDGQGREFSADTLAAVYLGDSNSFLTEINPGNSVEGVLIFDIPADAVPT